MTARFLAIVEITLAMMPILLFALLFSRLGRKFSSGCRYAILCVLLLRLAIPYNLTLPGPVLSFALPAELPSAEQVFDHAPIPIIPPDVVSVDANLPSLTDGIPDTAYVAGAATPGYARTAAELTRPAAFIWLIGTLSVLAWQTVTVLSAEAKVRRWVMPARDTRLTDALARAQKELGIKRAVSLAICPEIHSPMLHGLLRPEILLPHGDYTDDALDAILRHELIHYRRGDLWWKLVAMIAASVHFFNPFVWLACREQEARMEESCDEAVFRTGSVSRKTYGEAMLAVAREGLHTRTTGLNTHFHASARSLKARFANILNPKVRRAGIWLIVLVLIVTALGCGLVSCREDLPDTVPGNEENETGNPTSPAETTQPDPALTAGVTTPPVSPPYTPSLNLVSPMLNLKEPIITQKFGFYTDAEGKENFHNGVLYATSSPRSVHAAAPGRVEAVETNDTLGLYVILDHGKDRKTVYGNLNSTALTVGEEIPQSGHIGQTGEANTLYFAVSIDGAYVNPEDYLRWELKPVFAYTLDYSLPRLQTWTPLEDPNFPSETVSRLGSEYTAIDYMLNQLYGEDHQFGRFTLLPEQIVLDGQTMDSIWEIHQSSYSSIWFAMTKFGGAVYLSENKTEWRAVRNGNFTSTLDSVVLTGTRPESSSPLFRERVWMVKNEKYDVILTGVATVKIDASPNGTLPLVFNYTIADDIPEMLSPERIADARLTQATIERLINEYKRAVEYLEKKYGEAHGYTALILQPATYENFESVWNVQKANGDGFTIYMTPGGGSILIGSLWSEEKNPDSVWAAAPRYTNSDPYGDAYLERGRSKPLFPCDVIFNLP